MSQSNSRGITKLVVFQNVSFVMCALTGCGAISDDIM